jgi:hypothetical protein
MESIELFHFLNTFWITGFEGLLCNVVPEMVTACASTPKPAHPTPLKNGRSLGELAVRACAFVKTAAVNDSISNDLYFKLSIKT